MKLETSIVWYATYEKKCALIGLILLIALGLYMGTPTVTEEGYVVERQTGKLIAYNNLREMKELEIPEKVKGVVVREIGDYVFREKGIESVKIPKGVTKIGSEAFKGNDIKKIDLSNILEMGEGVFKDNELEYVKLSDKLGVISRESFRHNNLRSIEIPKGVKVIQDWAFYGNQLQELEIGATVEYIGSCAFGYNKLEEVKLGKGVVKLEPQIFNNNNIKSIDIAYVRYVARGSLHGNEIEAVKLGDRVEVEGRTSLGLYTMDILSKYEEGQLKGGWYTVEKGVTTYA